MQSWLSSSHFSSSGFIVPSYYLVSDDWLWIKLKETKTIVVQVYQPLQVLIINWFELIVNQKHVPSDLICGLVCGTQSQESSYKRIKGKCKSTKKRKFGAENDWIIFLSAQYIVWVHAEKEMYER